MHPERQWRRIHEYEAAGNAAAAVIACLSLAESLPDDARVWECLARLETRRGRYRAAHSATTEAANAVLRAQSFERLSHVTLGLLGMDEWHVVRQLIAAADHRSPVFLRQAPSLAQQLMLTGDDTGARHLCSLARTALRPDARVEYIDGLCARNLGLGTEAVGAFERAIGIDEDFSPAHRALAYHRPAGVARIPRLEAALGRQRQAASAVADICHALYRENEAAGFPQVAWTWLARGVAAARSLDIPWPRGSTPAANVTPLDPPAAGPAGAIFIVGLPRSGTTVLERILGNHSRVHAAGELNSFHAALCHAADRFLPQPSTTREVPPPVAASAAGPVYRRAIRRHCEDRIVVDKNPANFLYSELIARALPDARILCLRRAPLDACFSNLREPFEGGAYGYSNALDTLAEQYRWFDAMRENFSGALPGRFMTVPYEALVAEPAAMARKVLEFCGLDYEEGCERIERNTAPVSTASSSQVREPVHVRGVGAWRTYAPFLGPLRTRLDELGVTP